MEVVSCHYSFPCFEGEQKSSPFLYRSFCCISPVVYVSLPEAILRVMGQVSLFTRSCFSSEQGYVEGHPLKFYCPGGSNKWQGPAANPRWIWWKRTSLWWPSSKGKCLWLVVFRTRAIVILLHYQAVVKEKISHVIFYLCDLLPSKHKLEGLMEL